MATTTLDKSNKDTFLAAFDQFERGTADAPAWLAAIRKSAISRFGDLDGITKCFFGREVVAFIHPHHLPIPAPQVSSLS